MNDTNEGYLMWLIESDNLAKELAAAIAAYRRRNDTAPDTLLVHPERVERILPTDGLAVRAAAWVRTGYLLVGREGGDGEAGAADEDEDEDEGGSDEQHDA